MSITAQELDALINAAHERSEEDDLTEEEEKRYSVFYNYGSLWKAVKYLDVAFPVVLSDDVSITGTVAEYGGEGRGEEFWVVASVETPSGTQFFKKDGYYASYDGGYLDGDTYEVTPVEKTITVYEKLTN